MKRDLATIELEADQVELIVQCLLRGLACYGEIERLDNAQQLEHICHREVPEQLRLIDARGGDSEAISKFASALSFLQQRAA